VRNIQFYDERNARWLPFFRGDISEIFGPRFDEAEKNRLLDTARAQAEHLALQSVGDLRTQVQASARRTLDALAHEFRVANARIEYSEAVPIALATTTAGPAAQLGVVRRG
jgi:hypothetical protein